MAHPATHPFKTIILWLLLSFLLVACGQKAPPESKAVPQLNDNNIDAFVLSLTHDYNKTVGTLITTFNSHKRSGDSFGFTQFRNSTWTPAYIKEKKYYQSVYQQNSAYINSSGTKSLFIAYENLIYIGINLKNSLLDKNTELEKEAMASLEHDKATIKTALKSRK